MFNKLNPNDSTILLEFLEGVEYTPGKQKDSLSEGSFSGIFSKISFKTEFSDY